MRVAKRAMMLKEGIQPYPVTLDVTATIEAVRAKYEGKLEAGDETEDVVGIAGRVLFLRNAGGLCFVQLSAGDGTKIQGMISKKEIGADSLKQFKQLVDLGDHLYIKGRVIASKTGELSVFATEWAIASKALQPLPALHKDLNEDTRTRKPYIGMIADENIRNMVRNRSKAVASLRKTFADHDFLEVETPMLQTLHGGAAARPFTTHMNAFDLDLYLRIAPELFLKRCLVGGIDRVFEINRDFRNEGVDATHAPEFTMVEAYQAYGNYDTIGARQGARAEDRHGRLRLAQGHPARRHRIRLRRRMEDHQHVRLPFRGPGRGNRAERRSGQPWHLRGAPGRDRRQARRRTRRRGEPRQARRTPVGALLRGQALRAHLRA